MAATSFTTSSNVVSFLKDIFASSNFSSSKKQIYRLGNDGSMQFVRYFSQDSSYVESLENFKFHIDKNYYVTKNSMKFARERNDNAVFSFDNIVIDVDAHGKVDFAVIDDDIRKLIDLLNNKYTEFPSFNYVKTGRGVHIWLKIKSFAHKLGWLYDDMCHFFCDIVDKILSDNNFHNLSVDRAASTRKSGLVRLAGTHNTHRNNYITEYVHQTDEVHEFFTTHIIDGRELVDKLSYKDIYFKLFNVSYNDRCCNNSSGNDEFENLLNDEKYIPLLQKRKRDFEFIVNNRNGKCEGIRELILYFYFNNNIQIMSRAEAETLTISLNKKFMKSLHHSEVENILRNVNKAKVFKQETIWSYLNLGEDEMEYVSSSANANRMDRRILKEKRNENIIWMHGEGYKYEEIAEANSCCVRTVCNVINAKAAKCDRDRKILELHGNNFSNNEIAELVNCCSKTVSNVLKKAAEAEAVYEAAEAEACCETAEPEAVCEATEAEACCETAEPEAVYEAVDEKKKGKKRKNCIRFFFLWVPGYFLVGIIGYSVGQFILFCCLLR